MKQRLGLTCVPPGVAPVRGVTSSLEETLLTLEKFLYYMGLLL